MKTLFRPSYSDHSSLVDYLAQVPPLFISIGMGSYDHHTRYQFPLLLENTLHKDPPLDKENLNEFKSVF